MKTNAKSTTVDGVLPMRFSSCGFPDCDGPALAGAVMCERHRRVSVSQTGSWLEAG